MKNPKKVRKFLIGGAALMSLIVCYFLFEPVFAWVAGWQTLPEVHTIGRSAAIKVPEFHHEIAGSQKLLSKFHAQSLAPAVSIAIGVKNKIVWAEARGYSDIKKEVAADIQTVFRIGGVSKAVTSVGLGRLLKQGKISLDDTVGQYVPYFSNPEITIRQLASYMSGIRNYGLCFCFPVWEYYNLEGHNTIEKSIEVFNGDALLFKPGTSFSYSTYNYTLPSAAMENASGKKFLDFLRTEVFKALGMRHTSGDYAGNNMENRATFYEVKDGVYKEAFPVDNSNKWPGGGIISTPSDLVKLANGLLNHATLKKETVHTLFETQKLADGTINPQNYALGWRHETFELLGERKRVQGVHHGGTATGATALLILFPEYQLSIAMMMNKQAESFQMFDYVLPIAKQFINQ